MALEVTLSYTPVVNFAMQQNHAPVIREIRLLNTSQEAVDDVTVRIAFEPAFAYEYTAHVETVAPGCEECLTPVPVTFSTEFLSNLTERIEGVMLAEYVGNDRRADLEKFLANGDLDNYRITIHSLKSTSLTIGAVALSNAAKALEMACKEGDIDFVRNQHAKCMADYKLILEKLSDYLATGDL